MYKLYLKPQINLEMIYLDCGTLAASLSPCKPHKEFLSD